MAVQLLFSGCSSWICSRTSSHVIYIYSGHIDTAIWMHYMDANKTAGEETRWQLHKNAACNPEQVLAATPHKTPTVRPPAPYHEKGTLSGPDSTDSLAPLFTIFHHFW